MSSVVYIHDADKETFIVDGYVVDPETGEVLGFEEPPQQKQDFEVVDVESAEWVMRKMLEADSAIKAVDGAADVILARSILEQSDKLKAPHRKKIEWLQARFGHDLEMVARANLPKKGKTWSCLYGSVSFRAVKAKLDIKVLDRACKWLAAHFPATIRLEADLDQLLPDDQAYLASLAEEGNKGVTASVMKSKLPAELLIKAANTDDFEVETGIAYVAERESATITIGAK